MRGRDGVKLTAEQADRIAEHCDEEIERPGWINSPYDQDKLANLRKRRDEAKAHAKATRDAEREEVERRQAKAQADDEVLLAAAPARMAMFRDEIEAGRESADWLAMLMEHQRRAEAAGLAIYRLRKTTEQVQAAAKRRGVKAPKPPEIKPLPDLRRLHRMLPTPDAVVREEHERLARQSQELKAGA